jgi:VIT1/CCC1 family predicted Fe2+/Mn2+ transporter
MKAQLWKGCGFGITSGTITTLGLIAGLHSGTQSKLAILVGIIVLAVADALSDAIGIHISEEAENQHTPSEQWQSAFFTFISKLCVALSFIIPLQLFDIFTAILASVVWGALLISIFSYLMAKSQKQNIAKVIAEHVTVMLLVVVIAHFIGDFIHELFAM